MREGYRRNRRSDVAKMGRGGKCRHGGWRARLHRGSKSVLLIGTK
jgi:hypothetical protein